MAALKVSDSAGALQWSLAPTALLLTQPTSIQRVLSGFSIQNSNKCRMKHFETWNIRDAKICKVLFSRKYKCLMKSMILMVLKANEKNTLLLTVSCPLCLTENIFGNLSAVLWKSILKLDSFFCSVSSVAQQRLVRPSLDTDISH